MERVQLKSHHGFDVLKLLANQLWWSSQKTKTLCAVSSYKYTHHPCSHHLLFFFAVLFCALTSFFNLASTTLYLPFTPFGLP